MGNIKGRFFSNIEKNKYLTFVLTLTKWIFWGCIIGVFTGSATALFKNIIKYLTDTREAQPLLLFLLPVGGIVIGFLYKYIGKESDKGNNLILDNIHNGQGTVPLRMGPIVYIASFITHLFGGSTGREAAAVQMGASISEAVNRIFKIGKIDRMILLMSGISGGFGSAFSAPMTGTIFGMEVVSIGQTKYEALVPCLVASFTGHFTAKAWGVPIEKHTIHSVPNVTAEIMFKVIVASIIFGFVSVLYSQLRHSIEKLSKKYLKNPMLIGMVGGLIIIALTYIVGSRDYTGRGLKIVSQAFDGEVPPFAFLAKLVFTAVTMGMGFRGGEAIPMFFVGATLGNTLAPMAGLPPSFLAAIGLITVFSGAANAPISCFLLGIEMFEGKAIVFFFVASLVSYLFSGHHGIYPSQKLYKPKSRLLNLPEGETIAAIEQKKNASKQS